MNNLICLADLHLDHCAPKVVDAFIEEINARTPAGVLIDDIDKPRWRDCGYAFLRDIIHGRYEDKKRVIITANTDPPRTRDMWFERAEVNHSVVMSIFDRLKPGQRIEMQGSSHR